MTKTTYHRAENKPTANFPGHTGPVYQIEAADLPDSLDWEGAMDLPDDTEFARDETYTYWRVTA